VTVPPLVGRARAAAAERGSETSCRDEDGRLLHVLAGRRGVESVAEIGTGAGVGTAWLASALPPGVPLYTAEVDPALAKAAAELFAADPDVHVLEGDWRVALAPHAPFDLIFVDGGRAKDYPDAVLGLAVAGSTLVMDGFRADESDAGLRRERWLSHPRVSVAEVGTGGDSRVLVATVRP
jgi:predicted O-methyltransferase YrrM